MIRFVLIMFLKWTNHLHCSSILNYSLLILFACQTIKCQDSSDTTTTTTSTTSTPEPSTNTSDEILLAKDEFVDYTEAPTLLFDGLSNDSEIKPNNNETTSDQEAPSTTLAPTSVSANSTSEPSLTATEEPASDEADESDVTTTNDDDAADGNHKDPTKRPFEPPQNVSQYMDYIESLFHDLRHQITDLFEPHIPQLIRTSQMVQLSNSCSYDMLRMALALRQFEPWALRMIDSSGKVPEGIFEGSFTALGSYDECIQTVFDHQDVGAPQTSSEKQQQQQVAPTQGKYCLVNVSPFLPPKPPADKVERMFQDEANRRNLTKVSPIKDKQDEHENKQINHHVRIIINLYVNLRAFRAHHHY